MATDFFDQQHAARQKTGRLIAYFVLAVTLIVAAVYLAVTLLLVWGTSRGSGPHPQMAAVLDWQRLGIIATATALVIVSGSLYKIATLREGGASVARLLGGKLVNPNTTDLSERRLLNVVEEMAIASGTPVPPVYVLDDETGINAFAAGFGPGDAVIGITRGSLRYLTRDELQGVIGHEFSHILNGDMRLNLKLIGVLHGILLIALIGQLLMRFTGDGSSSRSREKGGDSRMAFFLLGLALFIIGYLGVFFGRLIKCAVCREREFLADASSVQFTRNPGGITGALKKIGGLAEGSEIDSPHAEQACHMFFGQGVSALSRALATHPPLQERIRRIDPSFDGRFPAVKPLAASAEEADDRAASQRKAARGPLDPLSRVLPLPGAGGSAAQGGGSPGAPIPLLPAAVLASVGAPRQDHIDYASSLMAALPSQLLAAAHDPFSSRAVVFALLIDESEPVRAAQLQMIADGAETGTVEEVNRLLPLIGPLGEAARIPLVDLALPTLRQLSPAQYETFRALIDPLVAADRRVSLFEFALQRLLLRHLDQQFRKRPPASVQFTRIEPLLDSCAKLLSSIAYVGQPNQQDAERAFDLGATRLGLPSGSRGVTILAKDECSLKVVDAALERLGGASARVKKRVLDACTACIAADGRVTVEEGELLRAIADSLDCPLPPLLARPLSSPPQEVAEAAQEEPSPAS